MQVKEIMTRNPVTCYSGENLIDVALRMWDEDCDLLTVIEDGRVRAVITYSDICTFKGAGHLVGTVGDAIRGRHEVYTCSPEDDVRDALKVMSEHQVSRLPVVDDGRLKGLVSMSDIAQAEAPDRHRESVRFDRACTMNNGKKARAEFNAVMPRTDQAAPAVRLTT